MGEYAGRAEGVCVEGTEDQNRRVGGVCVGFEVGIGGGKEGAGDEHWELFDRTGITQEIPTWSV